MFGKDAGKPHTPPLSVLISHILTLQVADAGWGGVEANEVQQLGLASAFAVITTSLKHKMPG